MTASEYGLKAQDAPRQMHYIELVVEADRLRSSGPGCHLPGMGPVKSWKIVMNMSMPLLATATGNTKKKPARTVEILAMNLSMENRYGNTGGL